MYAIRSYYGKAFQQAGADVLMPENLLEKKDLLKVTTSIDHTPVLYDVCEFTRGQIYSNQELLEMGFKIVIHPLASILMHAKTMMNLYKQYRDTGVITSYSIHYTKLYEAMGKHLVDAATAEGCTPSNPGDLAIFAGRVADWPNATYFFGGAFEELQPNLNIFNIVNQDADAFKSLALYTEATFNDAAKTALQKAMQPIDTDWNPETAGIKAAGVVAQIKKTSDKVFVLAPNDDTSAAIRQEFAKMATPYAKYYTTGQDASNVTLASLMGDTVTGKGTQTMTVFKDVSKLVKDSVTIAKNIVDGA